MRDSMAESVQFAVTRFEFGSILPDRFLRLLVFGNIPQHDHIAPVPALPVIKRSRARLEVVFRVNRIEHDFASGIRQHIVQIHPDQIIG